MIDLENSVSRVRRGWEKISEKPAVKQVIEGIDRVLTSFWLIIGSLIDPYWLLSFFFGMLGGINLYISSQKLALELAIQSNPQLTSLLAQRLPASGFDVLTSNLNTQIVIALLCIVYALIVANSKNVYVLTIGVIGGIIYSFALVYGAWTNQISILGWLAALYVIVAILGIAMTSYYAWDKKIEERKRLNAEAERNKTNQLYADLLAEVKALRKLKDGTTTQMVSG